MLIRNLKFQYKSIQNISAVENQTIPTEGKAAERPVTNMSRPPFLTYHLMQFFPELIFFFCFGYNKEIWI